MCGEDQRTLESFPLEAGGQLGQRCRGIRPALTISQKYRAIWALFSRTAQRSRSFQGDWPSTSSSTSSKGEVLASRQFCGQRVW